MSGLMRCALCGPASLHGARREVDAECAVGRRGFFGAEVQSYVKCSGCDAKFSHECLNLVGVKVCEMWRDGATIHDPLGVWRVLKIQPWRDTATVADRAACAPVFAPATATAAATLSACLLCEDVDLPPPPRTIPEAVRRLGPYT